MIDLWGFPKKATKTKAFILCERCKNIVALQRALLKCGKEQFIVSDKIKRAKGDML